MSSKSPDPRDRMGVFKRLSDVPPEYLLSNYEPAYHGRDVWAEFVEEHHDPMYGSDRSHKRVQRAGREWTAHMDDRGRHPALATPEDVEAWVATSLEKRALTTTYRTYWTKLEGFFTWLQNHTEHPHLYHPVLMAASEYPNARRVWEFKISTWRS